MREIYNFVFRGLLTEESLDKTERKYLVSLGKEDEEKIKNSLSFEMLDEELLVGAEKMSKVYIALHVFENMVRSFVATAMAEKFQESWWAKVPSKVEKK